MTGAYSLYSMPPTDTLKEFSDLERVSRRDSDHDAAVRYVQNMTEDAVLTHRLNAISTTIAASAAALLHERMPPASVLAGIVATVAGVLWLYETWTKCGDRRCLSRLHAPRIHMILDQIRKAAPSLEKTADEVEQLLSGKK